MSSALQPSRAGRDIFPIPCGGGSSSSSSRFGPLGRRTQQSRHHPGGGVGIGSLDPAIDVASRLADDAMRSLNWLSGHTLEGVSGPASGMHDDIRARADGLARRALTARATLEPAEYNPQQSFRELLGGRGVYQDSCGPVHLAPYKLDLLSMPASAKGAPELSTLLDEVDGHFLVRDNIQRYLRPTEERARLGMEKPIQPYIDPVLKRHNKSYALFIRSLHARSCINFSVSCECEAGVFFVWKKAESRFG